MISIDFYISKAWVIRVLGQSQFQDWENHFFVDRRLLGTSVQWILKNQNRDGTFEEPDDYPFPLEIQSVIDDSIVISFFYGFSHRLLIAGAECYEKGRSDSSRVDRFASLQRKFRRAVESAHGDGQSSFSQVYNLFLKNALLLYVYLLLLLIYLVI